MKANWKGFVTDDLMVHSKEWQRAYLKVSQKGSQMAPKKVDLMDLEKADPKAIQKAGQMELEKADPKALQKEA